MRNKRGEIVTTAVTNLDIHDVARATRTYGLKRYFLVHPLEEMQRVVRRILGHWQEGGGLEYNPLRAEAFSRLALVGTYEEVVARIEAEEGVKPEVWMTSARVVEGIPLLSWEAARHDCERGRPKLLVFGTGWGMTDEFLRQGNALLGPIRAADPSGFNHLSVRSAVAIALDRLLGEQEGRN
jgi:hypothetical protein